MSEPVSSEVKPDPFYVPDNVGDADIDQYDEEAEPNKTKTNIILIDRSKASPTPISVEFEEAKAAWNNEEPVEVKKE